MRIFVLSTHAVKELLAYFKQQSVETCKEFLGEALATSKQTELFVQHVLCAHALRKIFSETSKKATLPALFQHLESHLPTSPALDELIHNALSTWSERFQKIKHCENALKELLQEIALFFDKSIENLSDKYETIIAHYAFDWAVALQGTSLVILETNTLLPTFSSKLMQYAVSNRCTIEAFYNTTSLPLYYAACLWYPTIGTSLVSSLSKAVWNPHQQPQLFEKSLLERQNAQKIGLIFGKISTEWLSWALKRVAGNGIVVSFLSDSFPNLYEIANTLPIEEVREIKLAKNHVYLFKKSSSDKKNLRYLQANVTHAKQLENTTFVDVSPPTAPIWKNIFIEYAHPIELENESWLVDTDKNHLSEKVKQLITLYQEELSKTTVLLDYPNTLRTPFRWTTTMKTLLLKKVELQFFPEKIIPIVFKPFHTSFFYAESSLTGYPFEKWLGTDLQQPNIFIIHNAQDTWITTHLVHHKFLKSAIVVPKYLYDEKNNPHLNVSDESVKLFLEHYRPTIEREKEKRLSENAIGMADIKKMVDVLVRLSRNMPVLYKYTLKILDVLPRKVEETLAPEKAIEIFHVLEEYKTKIDTIGKGAKERQKLFAQLKETILLFQEMLQKVRNIEQEAQRQLAAINAENIFYYTFGMLFFYKEKWQNTLLLAENYFEVVEKSKKAISILLNPLSQEAYPIADKDSHSSLASLLKNVPEAVWKFELAGKPILKWWIEATKKHAEDESWKEELARMVSTLLALV